MEPEKEKKKSKQADEENKVRAAAAIERSDSFLVMTLEGDGAWYLACAESEQVYNMLIGMMMESPELEKVMEHALKRVEMKRKIKGN